MLCSAKLCSHSATQKKKAKSKERWTLNRYWGCEIMNYSKHQHTAIDLSVLNRFSDFLTKQFQYHVYNYNWLTIPNSSTPWRHAVALFVFCGILPSFLDWISLSVTAVNLWPESSLSVNMQVGRNILSAKIEIVNCLLVVCLRNEKSQNCFPKAQL